MDILSFILGFKKGIASGGGGGGATVDPVHTVTFMSWDGSAVLGQRSVVDGDNCADMVARGEWETPTRESTDQYNYTYAGWSKTSGGDADASALSAVTEDRTVYAAFTEAVRYYTITYLDDDGSVLKTESLAYGSMPSYTPSKEGFSFNGWVEGELQTVTGDATYTAQWLEMVTFAGGSWADIARISEAGEAKQYFKVGDTRQISLTNGETITVAIAGFDHDDLADGSGKAGISVVCMSVPSITYAALYSGESANSGYDSTRLYSILNSTGSLLSYLPSELKNVIKKVSKACDASCESGNTDIENFDFTLWTLSVQELGCVSYNNRLINLGSKYDLFPSTTTSNSYANNLPTVTVTGTTNKGDYWLRQMVHIGVFNVKYVDTRGASSWEQSGSDKKTIRFGFCI